ncbi:MAG: PQQ-dependent sugar dehydrogenase, partial [Actinomycetota bacterium]|nr:PQQ-dependent sugar dehydrogenase [Actinomycetota bacterium]
SEPAPPPPAGERAAPPDRAERPVRSPGGPEVETLASGLEVPWEIAFLPDGRALVTERAGRVRFLRRDGRLEPRPVARVARVEELGEGGLLGLALDPDFARNRLVYLYRTTASGNEVARFRLAGGRLREEATIIRGIAAAAIHDGGRLRFGPDRRLYVASGDAGEPDRAQDPGSLNGKILRMAPAAYRGGGGRPEVFSLGHRNPQGFDWQPGGDRLVAAEHGAVGNDEVNVLRRRANYGWPRIEGTERRAGLVSPVAVYPESIAPSGATFLRGRGSAWTGDFLIACLVGEQIRRVSLRDGRVTRNDALFEGRFGRLRSVVEGPDGAVYALTSNRDGRGSPRSGDDRVLRIVPPAG